MRNGVPVDIGISGVMIDISITPDIKLPKDNEGKNKFSTKGDITSFKKFTSEDDFKQYLSENESTNNFFGGSVRTMGTEESFAVDNSAGSGLAVPQVGGSLQKTDAADRVSSTNVQVTGIDEPDILKTDGKNIYFSIQNFFRGVVEPRPFMESDVTGVSIESEKMIAPDYYNKSEVKVINAFPPADLKEISSIDKSGNMLLSGKNMVIFSGNMIYGYDVSIPSSPKKRWDVELVDGNQYVQARLMDGKIYLVTMKWVNRNSPCPVDIFAVGDNLLSVPCYNVYHPDASVSTDNTYSVSTIDPKTGNLEIGISFLGSYSSTIYMSENALYIAYPYSGDFLEFFHDFVLENKSMFSDVFMKRIETLNGYDISSSAKMIEFQKALDNFYSAMSQDDRLKFENEMTNRMSDYTKLHKRDLEKTDIVKIEVDKFDVSSMETIPGRLLNQFSMDEYEGSLRVAVTVGGGLFGLGFNGGGESENDVYVLDEKMNLTGSIQGLGLDEKIYSARFIKDKGYLVTFRQIDPFFVLDLSDPKNPEVKGELKIPGYSSYLHPITKDKILGVGKEGSSVKLSLFDVSDVSNPKESSKYSLDEYWSEVLNTHHAFLLDDEHKVFFMPGGKGGYIFSYKDDKLKLEKAVSGVRAKRALYLDDYFYIVGDDRVVVLNESDWERVNELRFE